MSEMTRAISEGHLPCCHRKLQDHLGARPAEGWVSAPYTATGLGVGGPVPWVSLFLLKEDQVCLGHMMPLCFWGETCRPL